MRFCASLLPIALQGLAAIAAIVGMSLWPPASGRMLMVPLTDAGGTLVARTALSGGALLLGSGPFHGSLVVIGDRSRILGAIASWDIVVTAAPPAGCGSADPTGIAA
ncbi:hypothetical protein [Sphingomonas bacterium]|uniref:hypothetical protein n=1 Tax=Sphingomonas bacterium TaxID=1895847 RepID=UPI0015755B27|nr:hypothetical protein [Sphingomonas bacterium]